MAMVRKKQDDKYLEALRELITTGGGNRQCFDCGQKGPTYVNMTIGSFVCTRCSGVLRGLTPPHRVKSISMATFTQDEIDFLKSHGNDLCAKTWLGLWDPKRAVHQDQRELMIDKYERKRYYLEPASPLKSLTNATNLKTTTAAATSSSSTTSSSNSANNNQNNNNNRNNTNNNNTHIQLTPPTSQRTTANGLHKSSSSAISRPQHHNTFGLHNGLNSSVGSSSTGALSDTSSCASANGFGAEADFVADFSSADIFNATAASSPASSIASSTITNNGYAKIQPIKTAQQQFMNGHSVASNKSNLQNGNLSNGNTENFADFDHAPIYNAAVEEPTNYQFVRKNAIRKKSTSSTSGTILRKNERQLKDILEMDNNENVEDYINFEEEDVFGQSKTGNSKRNVIPGYSNLFDDFDSLLALDDDDKQNHQQQQHSKGYESDFANTTKFTPLALAAHATAMAVLGNQSHFNQQLATRFENTISKPQTFTANQWDVWSQSTTTKAASLSNTPWFSYEQQNPYASVDSCNRGNLLNQHQQQHQQQQRQQEYQQQFPFNTFPTSSTLHPSSAISDTSKTTISSMPYTLTTVPVSVTEATTTTTSMFKHNTINTATNPFRMHLDVNDNDNIHNNKSNIFNYYNSNNDYNYFQTTTTTLTPTPTSTTTTITTIPIHFDNNQNFDFVSNSILSYNFQEIATTKAPITTTSNSNTINTMTSMATQNYHNIDTNNNNNNYIENSNLNSNFDYNDNVSFINSTTTTATTNPFSNSLSDTSTNNKQQISFNDLYPTTMTTTISSYPPSFQTYNSSSVNTATTNTSLEPYSQNTIQNPFKTAPALQSQQPFAFQHQQTHLQQSVVDENANIYMSSSLNTNNIQNVVDMSNNSKVVANNNSSNFNSNSNCNFNSYSKTDFNSNSHSNSKQNVTDNLNNSWRLPNNNNNNNKNSTTNGFNNTNNNNINNNNNNKNNNNSSAPAEDRYAALKDLDEQLRESKAVAAQAASIVTANVVDSGFGNPNVNGTVNPFATHHQQTTVVNPFQNVTNNPTQNTTQQLFGQMTLIPNGIAAANGFLNTQKTHTANTGFFNYTASGFTNANTPQQLQQQHQMQGSVIYPTSIQAGPNGCGFGFGNLQQQITSTGTGLTTNTFNNPFAATGALNSNNPFL